MSFFFSKHKNTLSLSLIFLVTPYLSAIENKSPPYTTIDDKEEAFLIRRIAEFWKDQDFRIVKAQITDFLEKFPKSKNQDYLYALLGDIYLHEGLHQKAFESYSRIKSSSTLDKIIVNKLQALYELHLFEDMIKEGAPYLTRNFDDKELRAHEFAFLMGEAYFRYGLAFKEDNKKKEFFLKAEPFYEKALSSPFADPCMFALAEIYRLKKDFVKSASFFSTLAEKHPDQYDDLLFQTALLQTEFDKNLAIDTFSQIVTHKANKARDAALNRLILFFEQQEYQNVISSYAEVLDHIEPDKQTPFYYIVGRSYFAIQDHEKASVWLKKFISLSLDPSSELHNALLIELSIAQTLKNETLYNETISLLESKFPKDLELPQALFIHAMMLKEKKEFDLAQKKLELILQNPTSFGDQEALLLEYIIVSHNNCEWQKSHDTCVIFLKAHEKSENVPLVWKYLLTSGMNLIKLKEQDEDINYSQEEFLKELTAILARPDVLNETEKRECLFLQGKMAYEQKAFLDALNAFNRYISLYPSDPSLAEAHLLIALCHHKLENKPDLFSFHAEKALKENPEFETKAAIHLELYNAYLSLIERKVASSDVNLQDLAAEHLYKAIELKDIPIKMENRFWLANHFYHKILSLPESYQTDGTLPSEDALLVKTKSLFTSLLFNNNSKLISIPQEETHLEWEVLKYANLLGRENLLEEKIVLLEDLIAQQTSHPTWNWKLQKEALLELAKSYELASNLDRAFETFNFISFKFNDHPSFASLYAKIQAMRLQFKLLLPHQKNEDNPLVVKMLNDLKELQIRKATSSEPLHLEAALEYASLRTDLAPLDNKAERALFFLNRIKEDFSDKEDPVAQNYQKSLKTDAQKMELYALYQQFIEAETLKYTSLLLKKESHTLEAKDKITQATQAYQNILKGNSYYLRLRALQSLNELSITS